MTDAERARVALAICTHLTTSDAQLVAVTMMAQPDRFATYWNTWWGDRGSIPPQVLARELLRIAKLIRTGPPA